MSGDELDEVTQQLLATMTLVETLASTFVTAAASYRERCVAEGFSETAAEQMALAVHQSLIARALVMAEGGS